MSSVRRLPLLALPLGVAAAMALGGCGGSSSQQAATVPGTTVQGVRVARIIPVHETEYQLRPDHIEIERFGYYGIEAVNDGKTVHALRIVGHGIDEKTSGIAPGRSATMLVFFKKAGTYRMFCPIDGHRAKGMEGTVKVH